MDPCESIAKIDLSESLFDLCGLGIKGDGVTFPVFAVSGVLFDEDLLALAVNLSHVTNKQRRDRLASQIFQISITVSTQMAQEKTPSINFNFEDTHKRTEFSNNIFDLSCTNEKTITLFEGAVHPTPIHYGEISSLPPNPSKLKTQEFFQEFEKNFSVTFDGDAKNPESASPVAVDKESSQGKQEVCKMSATLEEAVEFKEDVRSGLSLENVKDLSDKNSPIPAFSIKKRTTFKSKKTIQENHQMLKVTKKKIYNKENMQVFAQTRSLKMPEKDRIQGLYLSLKVWKASELDESRPSNKSRSTIFNSDYPQLRETIKSTLNSTTLEHWRRKFDRKRSNPHSQQTVERTNIFKVPFSFK